MNLCFVTKKNTTMSGHPNSQYQRSLPVSELTFELKETRNKYISNSQENIQLFKARKWVNTCNTSSHGFYDKKEEEK